MDKTLVAAAAKSSSPTSAEYLDGCVCNLYTSFSHTSFFCEKHGPCDISLILFVDNHRVSVHRVLQHAEVSRTLRH